MDDNLLESDLINDAINEITRCFMNFVTQYKFIFSIIMTIMTIMFLILIIILFMIAKILKIIKMSKIKLNKILFINDYNKLYKKKLKMYGNCKISKIYLVRNSICKSYLFLMNLFTLFEYDKIINNTEKNAPYHTMMILEVKLDDNRIKWLMLEKNNCITIKDNFILTQGMQIEEVKIKKRIRLKDFLEETRNRMGNEKFFNWHIFENDCQEFTKELMITIESYNEHYKK